MDLACGPGLNLRLAAKAAAAPRLSRSEGESINRSNATAKADSSPMGWPNASSPSVKSSLAPPEAAATTALPHAIASAMTKQIGRAHV